VADPPPDCPRAVAVQMLDLVNAWRAQNGVTPALVLDAVLIAAAETKSDDMARTGQLSHTIDGVTARQNLTNHGYPTNVWWGENLAWGQSTAQAAFNWWKNSAGHNANMLNSNYRALGVGLEQKSETTYTWYWTQTFGSAIVERVAEC
jgi:uncharacterized protein YkwD